MKKLLLAVILVSINYVTAQSQNPALSSLPSSPYVIYLNFHGEVVNNANWYSTPVNAAAPNLTTAQITDIFNRVAEKYRPFNINVTTDSNVYKAAAPSKKVHAVITPTSAWYGSAGGVAYVGSFGYTVYDPAWIFSNNLANTPEYIADAIAHEVGHTLGLQHHGSFNSSCSKISDYHSGKGSGQTGWGPIMGAPYGMNMVLWYKGATTGTTCATAVQDDLSIITTSNGFGYRPDDKGNTIATAATLGIVSNAFSDSGLIEQNTDVDMFKIVLSQPSSVTINSRPYSTITASNTAADLDIRLVLYNASSQVIALDTPVAKLNASVTVSSLAPGSYYISINSGGNVAYTDYGGTGPLNYGCLGRYYLTGTITPTGGVAPVAAFTTPSSTPCAGQSVALTDNSLNVPASWTWQCTGASPSSSTSQNPSFTFASGGTYSMKLKVTNAFGKDSITKTITINSNPAITLSPNTSICSGNSTPLTVSGASTYSWSPSLGLNVTTGTTVSANPAATTTYTVTGTASGCSASTTVAVTVNALPVLTTSGNATICVGSNTGLTASGAATYVWSPSLSLDNNTASAVTATPLINTTYTVVGTAANSCSSSKTIIVTVNLLPILSTSSDAAICAGGSTNLTISGATTYTWLPSSSLNNNTASAVTATPSLTTTYTVNGTNNGCSSSKQVIITVNAGPVLTTSSNTSICNGSSAPLTVNGASTYVWSPSSSLNNSTTGVVTATPSASTTYTVTGTGGNSCTSSNTIVITVNALPALFISPNTSVCSGGSANLVVSGASTYLWSPTATLNDSTSNSVTASPLVNTTYTVTGTDANNCTATNTVRVTVNALPVLTVSADTTICSGNNVTLNVTGAATYTWAPATGLNNSTASAVVSTPDSTTTYTVTGANGACTSSKQITITVNQSPVLTINPNTSVCDGNPATLSVSGATTYSWTPSSTLDNDTSNIVIATPSVNTTYTVTGTGTNGCSSTKTVVVTVNATPSVTVSSDATICSGANTSLSASGAISYVWAPSAGLDNPTVANVSASPSLTTTYTVTGANGGCTDVKQVVVTVNPIPAITTSGDAAICSGSSASLTVNGASTYTWSPSASLDNDTANAVTATPSSSTTYTITGTGSNGCTSSSPIVVTVNAIPNPVISGTTTICSGSNTTLTVSGASTYIWSPSTGIDNPTASTVLASPVTTTTYTVTGTTSGCSGNKTIVINVIALPSITTSGDVAICNGSNSTLTVSGASTYTWSPAAGLNTITAALVSASPTVTTTYTVIGTSIGCSSSNQVIVTVNANPSLTTSANTAVCSGNPATLTVSGASTYVWSPSLSLSSSTATSVTATPASNTTYTVTGTGVNGCTSNSTITVTVGALPTLTTSADATVCSGANTALTVSGATTYAWAPATGLNNTTASNVTATPSSTTTYTVTGTSGGCSSSKQVAVTVNAVPVLTTSSNTSICNGSSATLTVSGATTYAWSPSSSLNNSTASSVTATPSLTTTYTVTGTSLGCSASNQVSVTVNTIPTLTTSSNTSICNGSSTALTVSGGTTYSWSPAASLNNSTASSVTATPTLTTTYTVTGTTNGCSGTKTVSVTVNAVPVITLSSNTSICNGSSTTLTAGGATTYSWSPSTGLNSTTATVTTANPTITTTYTVTGTSIGCSATKSVAITVNALPVLVASPNTSICNGSSTALTVSGAVSYSWTPASSLSNSTGSSVTASPTINTTYIVTGTSINNCTNNQTITITVKPLPVLVVSSDATICSGTNTTLTVSGATSYVWSPASSLNSSTAASVTATPATTTTYTVTGTTNACSSSKQVAITVKATPVVTVSSNTAICNGSSTALTASGATTYSWSPATGLNSTTAASITAGPTLTTTYSVTGTTNGCSGSNSVVVTVNALPVLTLTSNTLICNGSSTPLTSSGATTYSWLPATGLNNTTAASVTANPSSTITYTVTGTKSGCNATKSVTVTVNAVPVVTISSDATICNGSSTGLTAGGATTYSWSPATSLNNSTLSGVTANPIATTTYTATGTSNGCSATKTVVVTVNALPVIAHQATAAVCNGNSTNLAVSGAISYTWSPAEGLGGTNSANVTAGPTITTTYTITGTGANGCTASVTTILTVNANPVVTVSAATSVCSGSSAPLTAGGATTYSWSPAGTLNTSTGASVGASPTVNTTYTVIGTTNGCTATKTVSLDVKATPQIAYIITNPSCAANSDGAVNITVTGTDSMALSYLWSNGNTTQNIGSIDAGPYVVTVSASDGCSASANVAVQANACGIPGTLSSTNVTSSDADVHWKQILCSYGYKVRTRPSTNNNWTYFTVPASDSSLTVPNLVPGTTYFWQIESFCNPQNSDSSGYSSSQTFATDNSCPIPAMPSIINVTESTGILMWHSIGSAERYQIRYQTTSIDTGWTQVTAPQGALFDTLKHLVPATQYAVQMRSVCDTTLGNISNWSVSKIFTTPINGGYSSNGVVVENKSVTIYPNPASGVIRIEASFGEPGDIEVSVVDVTGRNLSTTIYHSPDGALVKEMDISALASGLYFIKLAKDDATIIKRIVKQ